MSALFSELHDALRARLEVVADHELRARDPQAHLERLKSAASRLNDAVAQLPPECDRELRHFLERQSYTKALAWLEGHREGPVEARRDAGGGPDRSVADIDRVGIYPYLGILPL